MPLLPDSPQSAPSSAADDALGPRSPARRRFVGLGLAGAAALALPAWSLATSAAPAAAGLGPHSDDWRWLVGNWDVRHRRLKERLTGSQDWQDFAGSSACWLALGGLGSVDDNIVELPGDRYRGMTVRAYDPASDQWAIWWLDGRNPTHIDPPVRGRFHGDDGEFVGRDTLRGKPIVMRFRWHEVHGREPWWEQAFSPDDGASWEVNWRNYFTRTAARPTPLARADDAPRDFDFLVGDWQVSHRRLRKRLVGSQDWDQFGGTLRNWPVLGGHGNVGDNVFEFPSGTVRGIGLRSYDPKAKQWLSWWLDGRTPTSIAPPVRGGFAADGVGTFIGDDTLDGKPIKTRVLWSRITARSARWEQACSDDGGKTWETNWTSDFERKA
ncbi:hypothetical protein LVB77_04570 [Lysobacter sp. 5GHs7-4]|uniref:hypothetical protein n=1 Tax=Lysobacter sp. 5GHs7-4 TaxID=2904253 RepID=UPI001E598F74|nr:hypothetical protein [Lysobacter sp. 5GHs7-4]UHQ23996.1 hypothetical protein LVB77_04570 [Lysobacter sp. 5GHs7-4]